MSQLKNSGELLWSRKSREREMNMAMIDKLAEKIALS